MFLIHILTFDFFYSHISSSLFVVVVVCLSVVFFFFFLWAIQATHKAEEIVISFHRLAKDEEGRRIATMKAFEIVNKKSQDLTAKLAKADHAKKSAKAALDVVERQAEGQRVLLCQAEE